jgi:hypothetical protein
MKTFGKIENRKISIFPRDFKEKIFVFSTWKCGYAKKFEFWQQNKKMILALNEPVSYDLGTAQHR